MFDGFSVRSVNHGRIEWCVKGGMVGCRKVVGWHHPPNFFYFFLEKEIKFFLVNKGVNYFGCQFFKIFFVDFVLFGERI